jgi:hypothetical protein
MTPGRSTEVRLRRKAQRLGLTLLKNRQHKVAPYCLRHPATSTMWPANGQRHGLTIKQVDAILIERDPKPVKEKLDWGPIMEQAAEIVRSYDTMVTLRQLFYQLVSRQLIENKQARYGYLSRKTAEARREGWFPDLIDQTSEILVAKHFSSPEQALKHLRSIYRRDRSEGQDVTIYLAVEKAGIQSQLWSWFADMGLPILALGGYGSQSYKDRIKDNVAAHIYVNGQRVNAINVARRPAVLIYAGDHDASGDDIFRDLVVRTDPGARLSDDYTTVTGSRLWKAVHRIALTKEQVDLYDLPENPGKDDDPRSDAFMERHDYIDNVQVELDALSPDVLRGLYQSAIDQYWDTDAYDEVIDRENDDLDELDSGTDDDK